MKKSLTLLILVGAISIQANAQCNPIFANNNAIDTFCANEIISLRANSTGYTSTVTWDFDDGSTSSQTNPTYVYRTPGTYTIIFKGSGSSGVCTDSLTAFVKPISEIKISLASADSQCFKGNRFCLTDSTIPATKVISQSYIFSNGLRIDTLNPVFPVQLCMFVSDPAGGYFDMAVHSADSNGCVAIKNYTNFIYVHPKVETRFVNITPMTSYCDSTLGRFKNKSNVPLSDIQSFTWDWGDSCSVTGSSSSNLVWWTGPANDGVVEHLYTTEGKFDVLLTVTTKTGCVATFKWFNAAKVPALNSLLTANFNDSIYIINCETFSQFTDLSSIVLKCADSDQIISWHWDFGDGGVSNLQNPHYKFRRSGNYDVSLAVATSTGETHKFTKTLYIPGPQPRFELDIWDVTDTLSLCAGDSLSLINTSQGDITNPTFQMDWGDGTMSNAAPIGKIFGHRYTTPGIYALYLTMEDNILGTNDRCSRVYPESNPKIINKHEILVIVNEVPPASISAKTSPTYKNHPTEFTANLDPRYTRMNWNFDGINSFTRTAPDNTIVYQFTTEGIHEVVLSPEYDIPPRCWAKATYTIEVLAEDLNSIADLAKKVHIYPNPTDGQLHVEVFEGLQILDIQLMDLVGSRQNIITDKTNENRIRIDFNHLANDNYILQLVTSKGTISKKLTVSKN